MKDQSAPLNRGGMHPSSSLNKENRRGKKIRIIYEGDPGEETMKLNLLFIMMDLLSLMAYPFIFALGKLRQFSQSRERLAPADSELRD